MATDLSGPFQADFATRNIDNPELLQKLISDAQGFMGAARYGATAFGQPTDSQSSTSGSRATAYPVSSAGPSGTSSVDSTGGTDIGQILGLVKGGLGAATKIPGGIGSDIAGVGVPGAEGSSAAGTLGGILGIGQGASRLAQGDYYGGGMNLATGGLQTASGLGYGGPLVGGAGGLLGIGSGVYDLAQGRGVQGTGEVVGGGLGLAGALAPELASGLSAAGLMFAPITILGAMEQAKEQEKRAQFARGSQIAGPEFSSEMQGLGGIKDMASLTDYFNAPTSFGENRGNFLADILQGVEKGSYGDSWLPSVEGGVSKYAGLENLLTQGGYKPGGFQGSSLIGATPDVMSRTTGNYGNPAAGYDRWRSLIDALLPLGAGMTGQPVSDYYQPDSQAVNRAAEYWLNLQQNPWGMGQPAPGIVENPVETGGG